MELKLRPRWLLSLQSVCRGHAACNFWNDDIYVCQAQAGAALQPVVLTVTPSSHFRGACGCIAYVGYTSSCGAADSALLQLLSAQATAGVLLAMRMPSKPREAAYVQVKAAIAVAVLLGPVAALQCQQQPWQREQGQQ